jgi:hypothetical protein
LKLRRAKAADFARRVLEDDSLADDLESEDVESYAARKRLKISNSKGRTTEVANGNGGNGEMSKAEMADALDQALEILQTAYCPETTREEAINAIADAIDVLEGNGAPDEDEDDDSDDDV